MARVKESGMVSPELPSPAEVEARILNIAGRPVRSLCRHRACNAKRNVLLWDGRSDQGMRVPGGSYLVEVTARGPDGTSGRALTPFRLNR
jgi:flagellar hook assembly protein FlgD